MYKKKSNKIHGKIRTFSQNYRNDFRIVLEDKNERRVENEKLGVQKLFSDKLLKTVSEKSYQKIYDFWLAWTAEDDRINQKFPSWNDQGRNFRF